ncbi:MAG: hypothetical protein ABR585_03480 [Gemmatimonadaceae bacterium]
MAPSLAPWESFYVIVGSSGAALTGLQFVVTALGAESPIATTDPEIEAFGTPTIVHFCSVLFIAALLSAPWQSLSSVALVLGAAGAAGIAYMGIVARRAKRLTGGYKPVLEDWIWHVGLPFAGYGILLAGSIALVLHASAALHIIGATALILLFTGIHNSWDAVTYVAVHRVGAKHNRERQQ